VRRGNRAVLLAFTLLVSACLLSGCATPEDPKLNEPVTLTMSRNIRYPALRDRLARLVIPERIGDHDLRSKRIRNRLSSAHILKRPGDDGLTLKIRYADKANTSEIEVFIEEHTRLEFLHHDKLGGYLQVSEQNRRIKRIDGQIVLHEFFAEGHVAAWYNGKTTVGIVVPDAKQFPAEVVEPFLAAVPSGIKEEEIPGSYDDWVRLELDRRIGHLQGMDWKALKTQDHTKSKDWERVKTALEMIMNLTRSTKEDDTYKEFRLWLWKFIGVPWDEMQKRPVEELKEDVKKIAEWWQENRETYQAGSRTHIP
jgi:hypothetical protein